jgi:hypothetical protein
MLWSVANGVISYAVAFHSNGSGGQLAFIYVSSAVTCQVLILIFVATCLATLENVISPFSVESTCKSAL